MEIACVFRASKVNSHSLEKASETHNVQYPRVLYIANAISFKSALKLCCSLKNACYSNRVQHISFPPMRGTGTREIPQNSIESQLHRIKIPSHIRVESTFPIPVSFHNLWIPGMRLRIEYTHLSEPLRSQVNKNVQISVHCDILSMVYNVMTFSSC